MLEWGSTHSSSRLHDDKDVLTWIGAMDKGCEHGDCRPGLDVAVEAAIEGVEDWIQESWSSSTY